MKLDENFWTQRYLNGETGWDIGHASGPLKAYFDQLEDTDLRILIPGCGNSYEAEYLFEKGFRNVFLLDISLPPLRDFADRYPDFPADHLLHQNFFDHQGEYDLIMEQTFFCALDPSLRTDYVRHMKQLLRPGGKLVGVLFDDPLFDDRPPFGGNRTEYMSFFGNEFDIRVFERCYNSIPARREREFFMIMANR